jgi:molybdate transport repressor ModE-like protein
MYVIDPKQLRTFATIAELASFTRAARRLGLSQSAASQQIHALETQLGVKLLHRTGAGAKPSPAGEVLLNYARQILRKMEEAQRAVAEADSSEKGMLRVGAPGPVSEYLLPQVLRDLRDRMPLIDVRIVGGHTDQTLKRLLGREIDVGLVTLPIDEARLRCVDLGRDELHVLIPSGHRWEGMTRVPAEDLGAETLVMWGPRCRTANLVKKVLLAAGAFPRIGAEVDDVRAAIEMVRLGLGIALVPHWVLRAGEGTGVSTVILGRGLLPRSWGVATLEEERPSANVRAFVRLCVERLPPLLSA